MSTDNIVTVGMLKNILSELKDSLPIIIVKSADGTDISPLKLNGVHTNLRYEEPKSLKKAFMHDPDDCEPEAYPDEYQNGLVCQHDPGDCDYARATPAIFLW